MSKVGNFPIPLNDKVNVEINGSQINVKGPKGELSLTIPNSKIKVIKEETQLVVTRASEDREARAQHGLYNTLVRNMVIGVVDGFEKKLELVGVGYRAQKKGEGLTMALGFSHPIEVAPVPGISFELTGDTKISIKGIDKQAVGQVAANIRKLRSPEPYKGKGIRYENERIIRKAGKAAK